MQPGSRLGVYELVSELGAGGMGVVWRAHDQRLGRDVALKILPPELAADPTALVRFEREARGLAALSHPNIVSIFDLGEQDGLRFLVTELLGGETLRDTIRSEAMAPKRAAEIGATIADGLAAAHAKGILHRDLKPENIFLTSEGRVKILDFGLAKEKAWARADATTTARNTAPGRILGTLGFISPEQLRGEEAGFASDIFSLGCVLYEMLAGRPAFVCTTPAETIAAILTSEPASIDGVPADLMRIVRRCLEKRPAARFQSASELAFALRHTTRETARMDSARGTGRRWAVAAAIVLAVAGVAAAYLWSRAQSPTPETVSLAVVPFAGDSEHAYAGEGLAESLFRRLAPVTALHAVQRRTASATPGATHVLRGLISGSGGELRVDAEVVLVATGAAVWKETYGGPSTALQTIESRIAADIERVLLSSGAGERKTVPENSVDPNAYREYLKGRHAWNKFTIDAFMQALGHFQKSIDHDPTYALAYAGLADTYTMLAFHGRDEREWMPKARAAATRAIELDPQLGEAHTSLGTVSLLYDWSWRPAELSLRRGVELNPRNATAHHAYSVYLAVVGRMDEALHEIETAQSLDPLSMVIDIDLAWIHYARGDVAKAIALSERILRHYPRSPLPRQEMVWYLEQAGRMSEAVDRFEEALQLDGKDPAPARRLREALRTGGAAGYLRTKLAMTEEHTTRGAMLARLGEHDAAVVELEAAYRRRERDIIYLKTSPTYDSLHGHPRFEKLVAEIF